MKTSIYSSLFISLLLFSSCSPVYYIPHALNVPLLSEKDEANVMFLTNAQATVSNDKGKSGIFDQFEAQASYAIQDNIGVQANAIYFKPREVGELSGSGYLGEMGVSYFTKISDRSVFEVYGLAGLGKIKTEFDTYRPEYNPTLGRDDNVPVNYLLTADMARLGIQPSIGYKAPKFQISLAIRFSKLYYNNVQGNMIHNNVDQVELMKKQGNGIKITEPAITMTKTLGHGLKLNYQFGFSWSNSELTSNSERRFSSLGVGWHF